MVAVVLVIKPLTLSPQLCPPSTSPSLSSFVLLFCLLKSLPVIPPMEQVTSVGDDVGEVETLQEFLNCISQLPADSSVHLSPVRIIFKAPPAGNVDRKEVEVKRSKTRQEKETVYPTAQDIPSNPKEPWDVVMSRWIVIIS
ncbi:hypothetical protein Ancab_023554 [Ancistrocladus abbreviatus]